MSSGSLTTQQTETLTSSASLVGHRSYWGETRTAPLVSPISCRVIRPGIRQGPFHIAKMTHVDNAPFPCVTGCFFYFSCFKQVSLNTASSWNMHLEYFIFIILINVHFWVNKPSLTLVTGIEVVCSVPDRGISSSAVLVRHQVDTSCLRIVD